MIRNEYLPGDFVSVPGYYEELNIFGSRTGKMAFLDSGETTPLAPRGYRWRPLAELSVPELRGRAAECRQMAATATTPVAMHGLLKLADRFDNLADHRDKAAGEASAG